MLQDDELYNKIWRVATAGYPYHTAQELGVDDWTYAYQATKTAIYDILGQTDVNNYYGIDETGRRTVDLMKRLVNEGENGTRTYKTPVSTIEKSGDIFLEGEFYIQNYNVTSNVDISSYNIVITGFPAQTKTTDTSGIEKSQFNPGETFQIRIPKNSIETGDINGKILANVNTKSYPIFYGKTYNEKLQNYAITTDPVTLTNSIDTLSLKGNTCSIKVRKVDVDTNAPIPSTIFELSKSDGTVIGTATTDASGIVTFNNLYQGDYLLKEIKNNADYVLKDEIVNVIAEYNKTTEIEVTNEKRKGQVKVIKVDKDNNEIKLQGVEFNILDSKGNVVDKLVTDQNGEAVSKRLPINETYTVQEVKTLQNYVLNTEEKTITLTENQITEVQFTNEKKKGQVRVIKIDEDYNEIKIPNVKFNILDSKGKVVDTLVTDKNGEAISKRLPIDEEYIIQEISTSEKYLLNEKKITVTLKENMITNVTITNKHKEGKLKVYKIDKDNNRVALGNVEFDLYSEEFGKIIGTYITDVNGEILIGKLRIGNYRLIEKTTNKWYNLADEIDVKIEYDKTTDVEVENELKKGQIKVIKVDEDDNEIKLAGVKFEVLDEDGNLLETITTDNNGEAYTNKYAVRDYNKLTLREIETLKNYSLNDTPQTIELKANEITTVQFTNELKKGQIKVIKVDKDNNEVKLEGVKFEVYDEENNLVQTLITDENGEAITDRLRIDKKYIIKETETNKDYALTVDVIEVTLQEDEIKEIKFENEKKKGQIQVIKVDSENNKVFIPDVTFEIYNSKNELVDTITTDSEGKATSKRLPIDDEYTIKETISNKAYVLTEETQTVILEEDEIKDITVENTKIYGKIKINKLSGAYSKILDLPANSPLANTKFLVFNSKGEAMGMYTTDETGSLLTENLPYGEYTIYEYEAPEHFIKDARPQTVSITEDGQIAELTFINAPSEPELPNTGF